MNSHRLPQEQSRAEILRARRKFTEQVVATVLFTVVELWATVAVLVLLDATGVLAVAAALALAAGLMLVYESWQSVRTRSRELRALMSDDDAPAESFSVDYKTSLVRL
jgi:hypothetical protein